MKYRITLGPSAGSRLLLLIFPFVCLQVKKVGKASPPPSLNDSLEGDLRAFLIDEDQLHTYDDLTKVNPVTPTTGE